MTMANTIHPMAMSHATSHPWPHCTPPPTPQPHHTPPTLQPCHTPQPPCLQATAHRGRRRWWWWGDRMLGQQMAGTMDDDWMNHREQHMPWLDWHDNTMMVYWWHSTMMGWPHMMTMTCKNMGEDNMAMTLLTILLPVPCIRCPIVYKDQLKPVDKLEVDWYQLVHYGSVWLIGNWAAVVPDQGQKTGP